MWENHLLSIDKGGHQIGTPDTWPFLGNVLRPSHLPLVSSSKECYAGFYSANRPLCCMPQPTNEVVGLGHVASPALLPQSFCSSS